MAMLSRDEFSKQYNQLKQSGYSSGEAVNKLSGNGSNTGTLSRDEFGEQYNQLKQDGYSSDEIVNMLLPSTPSARAIPTGSALTTAQDNLRSFAREVAESQIRQKYGAADAAKANADYESAKKQKSKARSEMLSYLLAGSLPGALPEDYSGEKQEALNKAYREASARKKDAAKHRDYVTARPKTNDRRDELIQRVKDAEEYSGWITDELSATNADRQRRADLAELDAIDEELGNEARDYDDRGRGGHIFGGSSKDFASGHLNKIGTNLATMYESVDTNPYAGWATDELSAANIGYEHDASKMGEYDFVKRGADSLEKAADKLGESAAKDLARAKAGLGKLGQAGVDIASNIIQMGYDVALGKLTGTSPLASMYLRSAGAASREARFEGATTDQQFRYGVVKGGIEIATEKIFDGVAGVFGKGAADEVVEGLIRRLSSSDTGRTVLRAIAGAGGEGTEEVISDLLSPLAEMIYKDESLDDLFAQMDMTEVLYDFFIGAAIGGLGSGGSIATGQNAAKNAELRQQDMKDYLASDLPSAIRGIYKQAGVELSDTEASLLADGYTPAGGSAQDYIFGTLDAYRLGGIGLTLEQAQNNSKYTTQLHPKQFEHAWQLGSAQKTAPESGTVNSNIGYSPERAAEIRHEGKNFKNLVAGIDTSIKDFFTKWKNGRKQHQGDKFEKLYLGAISDDARQKISSILGYEVTSTDYILSNDGVKHILDQHGDPQKEIANGNLPITDNVLESLPEVLANPDSIEPGGKDRFGDRDGVVFKKALADGNVVYIQFDNSGRKTIEGKTLYVKPVTTSVTNAGTPTPVSTPKAPEPVTQQESAAPAPNISQSGEDVNTEDGRGRLVSALAALGSHATEAADAYEAGQDISTYATAMNKAASLYAAHGADLKTIVQQARDGETADIVGVLTDAQVETAMQIGQQMQAKSRERVRQLDAQFKSIRERAAALQNEGIDSSIEAARKELAEVQRQFSEKLDAAEGEEAKNAYAELDALSERMNKLDSEIKALENEAGSKTAQRKKGTVSFEGAIIDGVKYKGVDRRKLNRQQKNIVAMVERLADLVNIDYVLLDGKSGMGGYYQGGKIYININFGMAEGLNKHIAAATLSHELTHFMRDYAPVEYEELKSYVVSAILKKSAAEFDALVQQQAQWEAGKSYEELVDELVANACQTMLLDDRAVTKLARQNMSLAEKIADVLEDIYAKIKAAFEEIDFSSDTALFRPVQAVMDEMDAIAERWSDGIAAATENYNALQTVGMKNAAPESGVRYQKIGVNEYGEEVYETAKQLQGLSYAEKLAMFKANFYTPGTPQYIGQRIRFLTKTGTYFAEIDRFTQRENINKINPGKLNQTDKAKINIGAAGDFVTLLENAQVDEENVPKKKQNNSAKKRVTHFDYFLKNVEIDGKRFTVIINIRATESGKYVYEVSLRPLKRTPEMALHQTKVQRRPREANASHRGSEQSISDAEQNSKGQHQRWDNTSDDTAEESRGRELAYTRLQSENAILNETVAELRKLTDRQNNTIGKLQDKLRLTKTPEARQSDARRQARAYLSEYGSRADMESIAGQLKTVGDYILQTPAAEVATEEMMNRARPIAAEIAENAYEQVSFDEENSRKIADEIKGKKLSIDEDFLGELDGGFETFRKRNFGRFMLSKRGRNTAESRDGYQSVDQFYADMQGEYGKSYFPDVANEGEELGILEQLIDAAKPIEVNPFEQYMGEAVEEIANRIVMDAMSGVLRPTEPTSADKQRARTQALRDQIIQLRDENKLERREGAHLYNTIYDLSMQLDKAESRYKSLRQEADYRTAQVRAEGRARAAEIKAAERERAAGQVAALKEHYREMQRNARQRREDADTRRKIRKLIDELNARLKNPTEKRHIPRELVQQSIEVLRMIDLDNGRSESLTERLATIRTMYEGYQNNPTYAIVYDDITAEMLKNLAETIGNTKLLNMSQAQLDAVYEALKSLNHVIHESINVRIGNEERSAYELAQEMTEETRQIPKAQKGWVKGKYLPAHLRADVAFRRFAGFKKNSAWEAMCRVLNDGQLRQTELQMRLSLPFGELVQDQKGINDFTAVNMFGQIDESKLVDIGLKDQNGDAVLVTHDVMVGIYLDLLNEDNRRHFIRGGKTVPNFKDFYNGKGGFGIGTLRAVGIAEQLSDAYHELDEAKRFGGDKVKAQANIDMLLSEGEKYANEVRAAIEKNMTAFDRKWVRATQQLMDVESKRYLNEVTMAVYGIEKARVSHYFPITTDPNFLSSASFDSITRDMSLENAGFMKERIPASNPTLAMGVVGVVNNQINRVSQYCGLMPAIRNFNKVYNKVGAGYSDSLKNAVNAVFGKEGQRYIENLIADLTGSRKSNEDVMGLNHLFAVLRGNLAQSTLTLNPRVALAQAASYPTAAAELGYEPLVKAFFRGGKSGRMISRADTELIAKYSPLLYLRMQGYSSPELGDIKNSSRLSSKVFKKLRWFTGWIQAVDGATVGRLWYAAEYWVQDNMPSLEKGTDPYYEAVAEKFNAVVEKTQPNYTPMQRAAILRESDGLLRTFTMFMTQRLQNFNILYDSAASYQKVRADFANRRNGVTQEDMDEAKTELLRAATSQLAQAGVFTAFKFFADALLHRLDDYRDDETGEFTGKSLALKLLDNYIDAFIGTFLLGSELYGIIKGMTGASKYYGLSLSGVDSINDLINSFVSLSNADYDMTTADGRNRFYKKLWKTAKDFSTALGIPATNIEKIYKAIRYHIEDMAAGEFGSFNAGYDRTATQNAAKLIRALENGDEAAIQSAAEAFDDEQAALKAVKDSLKAELASGKRTADEVKALLQKAGMTEDDAFFAVQGWESGDDNRYTDVKRAAVSGDKDAFKEAMNVLTSHGYKEKDVYSEVRSFIKDAYFGKSSEAEAEIIGGKALSEADYRRMLRDYTGLSTDDAVNLVKEWMEERNLIQQHGAEFEEYGLELSQAKYYYDKARNYVQLSTFAHQVESYGMDKVKAYYGNGETAAWRETGLTLEQYITYSKKAAECKGTDLNGDGMTDNGSVQAEIIEVIDSMPVSEEVKDAIFRKRYPTSKRRDLPWHQ